MSVWSERVQELASNIQQALPQGAAPKVGLVLGSGLGAYTNDFQESVCMSFESLGLPAAGVAAHAGNIIYGKVKADQAPAVEVLALQGRLHYYEGHTMELIVLPLRALISLGCRTVIITNVSGGIRADLKPGHIVLITDHINLQAHSPLRGINDPVLGPRFPDMNGAYDPALIQKAEKVAQKINVPLSHGIYAGCLGPQYETPAEIRMMERLGADMVGMSTVAEVIAARHMGAKVLGISCITNKAAGLAQEELSHEDVVKVAALVRMDLMKLLDGIITSTR